MSNLDFAVKIGLVFAISAFAFGIGTALGHQVSTADERRAALELKVQADDLFGKIKAHGPTYQEQADEINNAPRQTKDCFNQLSPRAQAQRVKDILGAAPVDLGKVNLR